MTKRRFLIAFDLDGTVLPSVRKLPPHTVDVIRAAASAGHIPMIATARPWEMTEWVYRALGLTSPVAMLNGARLFSPDNASFPAYHNPIPASELPVLIASALRAMPEPPDMIIENGGLFFSLREVTGKYYGERAATGEHRFFTLDNIPNTDADRVVIYTPTHDENLAVLAALRTHPGYRSDPTEKITRDGGYRGRLTLSRAENDKFNCVSRVAEYYGIPNEDVFTFGDEWNDLRMVSGFPRGYALRGSPAEPYGRNVTRFSCAEGGVADVIEREILSVNAE